MTGSLRRTFGEHVRSLRRERGLTQEVLAERSGLSVEAVGRIERGAFSPTLDTIEKLSRGLEAGFDELFRHFQDDRPDRVVELCQFLSGLSNREVEKVWHILQILFDSSRGKRDQDFKS